MDASPHDSSDHITAEFTETRCRRAYGFVCSTVLSRFKRFYRNFQLYVVHASGHFSISSLSASMSKKGMQHPTASDF